MKKIILSISLLFGLKSYSQNTIPTTTVTGALSVNDSLKVTMGITAIGDIKATGEVISKDTMRAQKDFIVDGNVSVGGKLKVEGNTIFNGNLTSKNGIVFNNTNGISFTPSTGSTQNIIQYGSKIADIPESCAAFPQAWANHQFGGMMQLYNVDQTGSYISGHGLLNFQTWAGGSSIDASIGGSMAQSGNLLLNYFCGNDVSICQGALGGVVGMGKNVEIGTTTRNISTLLNLGIPSGTTKAIAISDPALTSSSKIVFEVSNTGKTFIGIGRPKTTGLAANAMLSVDGLILAKEVRVAVANTHWADYVFDKSYKLKSLAEVENYINENKHLPDVPSVEEVNKNGIDVVETNAILLKKIEELTLYLIDMKKEIDALKKK